MNIIFRKIRWIAFILVVIGVGSFIAFSLISSVLHSHKEDSEECSTCLWIANAHVLPIASSAALIILFLVMVLYVFRWVNIHDPVCVKVSSRSPPVI